MIPVFQCSQNIIASALNFNIDTCASNFASGDSLLELHFIYKTYLVEALPVF